MLERFSAAARRAVDLAAVEARRLGHPHVGTEHLLLGLLAESRNPAARLLRTAGAPLSACREKVSEALGRRDFPPARASEELELTDRAARAMDRAGKLSLRMKSEEVGAAHLLISVLDVEGTAGQVLRGLNVDLVSLHEDLLRAAGEAEPVPAPAPAESAAAVAAEPPSSTSATPGGSAGAHAQVEPVCATCGSKLASTLARTVVASTSGAEFEVAYCSACGAAVGAFPAR